MAGDAAKALLEKVRRGLGDAAETLLDKIDQSAREPGKPPTEAQKAWDDMRAARRKGDDASADEHEKRFRKLTNQGE